MTARVAVISPPFFSHAQPMSVLAGALRGAGARTTFACGAEFAPLAERAGVDFRPLGTTANRNTGIARRTAQGGAERDRLAAFLDATRRGAVPALLTQTMHRRQDMLAQPRAVLEQVRALHEERRPDWYLVDQLNYPVTLAMYCLGLRFATYCPGHPSYLLERDDQFFGVPDRWPDGLAPSAAELGALRSAAELTDRDFTAAFNAVIAEVDPSLAPIRRAFAYTSPHARVFNYPPPPCGAADAGSLYLGHCGAPGAMPPGWRDRLARWTGRARVLVSLGTFLSARDDVLRNVVEGVRRALPGSAVIVAAGDRAERLADLAGEAVAVEEFVPQQELLPHVDLMVHHGGNNSFTECLRAAVPALVLPFSSDQFAVACDAVRLGVARCLDPNAAGPAEIAGAVAELTAAAPPGLGELSGLARERGPAWAAPRLLALMRR